ncbi:hypothetical protein PMN64_36965 [Bradyrhizobium sp. UFLA01-814]|uniref:hypothetical protein n=1 Tax=Bradyrhizobium sp. UFLA01-814 TaxID=3023480 RepID=UPI00398BA396
MTLRQALDRTMLLMRDELDASTPDDALLAALTETEVAIVADSSNLASHSAQTAFVTLALLMARSGHRVHLIAPDIPLAGAQPPVPAGPVITGLLAVGSDMLPGITFSSAMPASPVDLIVTLGDSGTSLHGGAMISINADDWSGMLAPPAKATRWRAGRWPLGAMAAAAMAATEAFKIAMRKLVGHARNPAMMMETFAPSTDTTFALAPADTPMVSALDEFDCVSGGAITQSALFALTRLPDVSGHARVIEPDFADLTNLNRYMLLLRSHDGAQKAKDLEEMCAGTGLAIMPIPERFGPETAHSVGLSGVVLVGVDDIPSRWLVQRTWPAWLGVGATTHWSAMASFHVPGTDGCAECLHPDDDPTDAPIPTVAFVSFWAGLLTAAYFLRHRADALGTALLDQQIYVTPVRPESPIWAMVPKRPGCATCA